jgi:ferredoxin/flavodoxin---NADP+ reductase
MTDTIKTAEVPERNVTRTRTRVVEQRRLSETGYELVLERGGLDFEAGRLITLHGRDVTEDRSYTIASGERDEHLHVLYRLMPEGVLTPQLVRLKAGDPVDWSGSYGQFVLRDPARPLYFIATGTGIAPCRAYVRTHPDLDLTVLHGVRVAADLFFRAEFERYHYQPCLSVEQGTGFHGRVTTLLAGQSLPHEAHYYLCGAYEMIYEMQDLLHRQGIDPTHIFTEGYYYRLEV